MIQLVAEILLASFFLAPVTAWSHAVLWLPLPMENYF
jgi:hypothetical protein